MGPCPRWRTSRLLSFFPPYVHACSLLLFREGNKALVNAQRAGRTRLDAFTALRTFDARCRPCDPEQEVSNACLRHLSHKPPFFLMPCDFSSAGR